ncbi:hypothetical protein DS731_08565 [Alteromonas sp. RKMC-009]|nr:hypothetical protein DS731_08565 [Alteromonas sp. RKMC-009]
MSELNWNLILGGSPAFVLPDGFYANSLDGTIVDNYFVGNVASLPATAVPAPATWLLFAITLVVVIVRHNHFCKIR